MKMNPETLRILKALPQAQKREYLKALAAGRKTIKGGVIICTPDMKETLSGIPVEEIKNLPFESLIILPSNGREYDPEN